MEDVSLSKVPIARIPVRKRRASVSGAGPVEVYAEDASHRASHGPSQTGARPPLRGERPEAASRRILLVDAQDELRRLLSRVLGDRGYEVEEATRGDEALEVLTRSGGATPDIVLLDITLPEIHGIEVCRRMKASQEHAHIPVVMLGTVRRGWRFAEDLRSAYSVSAFLQKPFKVSTVVATIEKVLDGKEDDDEDEDLSEELQQALANSVEAYQGGDLDSAILTLQEAIDREPFCFKLHYQLGLLFGRRENVMEAIEALETAIDLRPRNFSALKNLAVLYQRAGFRCMSVEVWERALVCAPDDETMRSIRDHLMRLL